MLIDRGLQESQLSYGTGNPAYCMTTGTGMTPVIEFLSNSLRPLGTGGGHVARGPVPL